MRAGPPPLPFPSPPPSPSWMLTQSRLCPRVSHSSALQQFRCENSRLELSVNKAPNGGSTHPPDREQRHRDPHQRNQRWGRIKNRLEDSREMSATEYWLRKMRSSRVRRSISTIFLMLPKLFPPAASSSLPAERCLKIQLETVVTLSAANGTRA